MGRWLVVLLVAVLCAGCSGAQASVDAGSCDDWAFVRACTPLHKCGSREPARPAEGKCDAGYFPVRDYACGPPYPLDGGGLGCGCRVQALDLPGVGSVDDERCVEQCSASHSCTSGTCTQVPAYWGSDTQFMTYVPLCL